MHRLAAVPGLSDDRDGTASGIAYIEQPPAPVLLLSSADTDLVAFDALLRHRSDLLGVGVEARALNLAALSHPAVIDHYRATTLPAARLVLVRLLGGRGHWSYGLEQLRDWAREQDPQGRARHLLVLSGTAELDRELAELGTVPPELAIALAACLREGGAENVTKVLQSLAALLAGTDPPPPEAGPGPDPLPDDWRDDPGPRVGVILYRALLQAGDTALMQAVQEELRRQGLCPRGLWVSSLRDAAVARGVGDLLERERVEAVLCGTGFASVQFEEAGLGAPLWERLGVPVLQLLCSGRSRRSWQESASGLGPLDLSLQVALPELDGRISSRAVAFKEMVQASDTLATALQHLQPDPERLAWCTELCAAWIRLRRTPAPERRVALVLANYPTRNSRLANGVGLDTPASTTAMLQWLQQAGHALGSGPLPADGDALIARLLSGRSNDPESDHQPALAQLSLAEYRRWYDDLPAAGRERLEAVWGPPERDAGLEDGPQGPGFAVRGLQLGHVAVLIQPSRGYDRDPSLSYHSPDLPPTHAYLAQYLWLRQVFAAQVVVHVGKHGNLEWLPGKGVGLSADCFPEWALGPMPHLYPFIVNDPGEGSQAKRRAQAVILDHLTPPLGRSGLHGALQSLETLLDEYWEACSLGGERAGLLRERLAQQLEALQLPVGAELDLEARLDAVDGYLCEIKEAQIRLGLHRYGQLPAADALAELLLCLARPPQEGGCGFTQALAQDLGLDLDPWADPEEEPLSAADRRRLAALFKADTSGETGMDTARGGTGQAAHDGVEGGAITAGSGSSAPEGAGLDLASLDIASLDIASLDIASRDRAGRDAADGIPAVNGPPASSPPAGLRCAGDGTARLEAWALALVQRELADAGIEQPKGSAEAMGAADPPPATPVWASDQMERAEANSNATTDSAAAPDRVQELPEINPPPAPGPQTEAALQHLRRRLLPALLACGDAEKRAFLNGIGGGRIAAGPSGAPTRGRPDLLPTGRNFYSVDLRGLPTEAAWDLGRRSAELLLDLHRLEQGRELRSLALSVWGTATMRNGGEDIAQALALMGVRPVWDGPSRRMVDLEVIPLQVLGRPRVDVTLRISGLFRDAFPQLVGWMNRAARLVAALLQEGEDNPLALAAQREGHWGRVWGSAPGAYGAGLQGLIDSGQWESRADLATAYLNWSQWRYDGEVGAGGGSPEAPQAALDRQGLEQRLSSVEVVLHNQDNREHDLLDSDDYYQFHGGLSAAVEQQRGAAPALWFGDHSRRQRPRLHRVEKEFDKVLRSRLLNPRWIEAMQEHGYKGGFEMAASLDYLFAYDASSGRVPDWSYGAISRHWLGSQSVLDFLRRCNPWALRDMAERLLEAQQRGLWDGAETGEIERLRALVLESEGLIEGA